MTRIIGHRGARDLWPENSLSGFRRLLDLGVEGVEFDLHLTEDGEILVIHDPTLERTTNASGTVARLRKADRAGVILDGSCGETIPTLEQVLALFADTAFDLHLELKTDATGAPYPGLERRAAEQIAAFGLNARATLTCFVPAVLETVRRDAPGIATLCSFDRRSAEMFGGVDPGLAAVLPVADILAVEKALFREASSRFLDAVAPDRIGVWVCNSEPDLRHWLAAGLRQITTDRPDLAVALRNEGQLGEA